MVKLVTKYEDSLFVKNLFLCKISFALTVLKYEELPSSLCTWLQVLQFLRSKVELFLHDMVCIPGVCWTYSSCAFAGKCGGNTCTEGNVIRFSIVAACWCACKDIGPSTVWLLSSSILIDEKVFRVVVPAILTVAFYKLKPNRFSYISYLGHMDSSFCEMQYSCNECAAEASALSQ